MTLAANRNTSLINLEGTVLQHDAATPASGVA